MSTPNRILRFAELRERTGLSRTTVWRKVREGSFPAPVNITTHAVGWRETEVAAWQASLQSTTARRSA